MPQLQSEELIERADQLAPIAEALAAARDREGRLLLISGPPGIGKTALQGAARRLGDAEEFMVLTAIGSELERGIPFGVVRQLFGSGYESNGNGRSAISSLFQSGGGEGENRRGSFNLLDDLYWHAQDLAQAGPLLLIVDDLQWSDQPSLQFLAYLCRRLADLPLAVLLATRSGGTPSPELEDLARTASSRLDLAPLSLEGVGVLIERVLGRSPSSHFAAVCREQTGGYPLYLEKMLEVAHERGLVPEDSAVAQLEGINAQGLAWHVWSRIDAVGAAAAKVAGLVAVLGEHADCRRIAELGELESFEVADAIAGLEAQGVLEQGDIPRFAHPVIRTAVEERVSARSLDAWHRGAAHLLEREGADVRAISGHLISCLPAGDEWIVSRLRDYAAAVLANGTPTLAETALERALAEPPNDEDRVPLLRELARAKETAGDCSGALEILDEALRLTEDPRQRAEFRTAQGSILCLLNRYDEALEKLEDAVEQITAVDSELERRIDVERINIAFIAKGFRDEDLARLSNYAGEIPQGPVGMGILTAQAAASAMKFHRMDEAALLAERALRTGGLRHGGINSEVYSLAGYILTIANRPDLARQLNERKLAEARQQGHLRDVFALEVDVAAIALVCGDIPTAVSRAKGALAVGEPGPHLSWAHSYCAASLLETGDLAAVEQALAATEPEHWRVEVAGSRFLYCSRVKLRIAQGRIAEAAADVAKVRQHTEAYGEGLGGGDDVWRWLGAIVAHREGDSERAMTLISEQVESVRELGSVGYLGRVLLTAAQVSGPDAELELLHEAVETLTASHYRLDYARSLVELGAALRRRGERIAAREPLKEGIDLAYRCGGGAVVSQGLLELKASGARPRRLVLDGPEALTPREARMAQLAARGSGNREIARELYVSLATVESTLWRAYAKLGISGHGARAALPEALGPLFAEG